jgi:hypothetical protein
VYCFWIISNKLDLKKETPFYYIFVGLEYFLGQGLSCPFNKSFPEPNTGLFFAKPVVSAD